jgi:general secretion pathway protein G
VEQTVGILQSSLQLRFASLIASNRLGQIDELVQQNPMSWLAQKPENYVGEYFDQAPEGNVSGKWYFDLKERNLVYFVHNVAEAQASLPQLCFKTKVVLAVEDFPAAERPVSGKVVEGVVLEQIVPYAWN